MIENTFYTALDFAAKAHANQKHKRINVPFVVHPFGVAMLLQKIGAPEKIVIVGLLHDVLEGTATTIEEVKKIFGRDISELVEKCRESRLNWEKEELLNESCKERKENPSSTEVKIAVCADMLDTVRIIKRTLEQLDDSAQNKFDRKSKRELACYYQGMVDYLRPIGNGKLNSMLSKLWVDLDWEVSQLFGEMHGLERRETREDVNIMLDELGKIGSRKPKSVMLYLSSGVNVKSEYCNLPFDYVFLSDYNYEHFEVQDNKVVLMPYDNNRTIQYLLASGIEVTCVVGICDGCAEGGNYECVNTAEFFRKLRPVLAKDCTYVLDHVNYYHSSPPKSGRPSLFYPYYSEEVPVSKYVTSNFQASGINMYKLSLDAPSGRKKKGH